MVCGPKWSADPNGLRTQVVRWRKVVKRFEKTLVKLIEKENPDNPVIDAYFNSETASAA